MILSELRFLVVEDHDLQRRVLLKMLEWSGATTLREAADGNAALQILGDPEAAIDVIITDLDMPGMDGIEFIRHVGESGRRVSVLLASAADGALLASVQAMAAAYHVDLVGVMEKPVSIEKLHQLLADHRGKVTPRRPSARRMFTPTELSHALDDGGFDAFFQPKIELATGRIAGFEVLARWLHPELGMIAPGDFIATMEAHGLIDRLTRSMLQQGVSACGQWRARGLDASVSLNVSVSSLRDPRYADELLATAHAGCVAPRHIIFEVTESVAAGMDAGGVLANVSRLRMKGFGISIDDFGTGYSSIQQLTRLPVTELKIDQSFVRDALTSASSKIILESSLDLARQLKLSVVAEGVETQAQWDLLRRLHGDLAQGYFIARPMSAVAVPDWIAQWAAGNRP